MELDSICPFVTGLSYSAEGLQGSPMYGLEFPSFLRLNNTPLYVLCTYLARHYIKSFLILRKTSSEYCVP